MFIGPNAPLLAVTLGTVNEFFFVFFFFFSVCIVGQYLLCPTRYIFFDSIGSSSLLVLDAVKAVGITQPSWSLKVNF